MSQANAKQVAGAHYKKFVIEIWDFIHQNEIPYLEGNVIKYVARWRLKGGKQDLEKCKHYIEKLIEEADKEEVNRSMGDLLAQMKTAGDPIPEGLAHLATTDAGLVGGMYGTLLDDKVDASQCFKPRR